MTKKLARQIMKAIEALGFLFGEMGVPGETSFLEPPPEPSQDTVEYITARMQFWAGELAEDPPPPPARKQVAIAVEIYEDLVSLYEDAFAAEVAKAERARKRTPTKKAAPEPKMENPLERMSAPLLNPCREFPRDKWSIN
jgi:hypothetical protein